MLRRFAAAIALVAVLAPLAAAQGGHEYAPLEEREVAYKDWTLPSLDEKGTPVNLRTWSKGKRLVLVVYYAPWCGNWRYEAPVVSRLYDKYKGHGFDVVGVHHYAAPAESRDFFKTAGAPGYTVVVGSDAREAREKTEHYALRKACDDGRNWGSPFNVFLEPAKLAPEGEVLAEKVWVVGGELVEEEVERFVRERLGLAGASGD
jgi:thiol-disulfide isomerase/thioredoxin